MNGWIKLTPEQVAQLTALSETNPSNNFLMARRDADGVAWLSADAFSEMDRLFVHYYPLLVQLSVSADTPNFPKDDSP